jgi:uroporphyrinogen-III decarboxylase
MRDCGIDVINCQEDCNTLEWLIREIKGDIAIDLCLSARMITVAEPEELRDYILRCADELSSPTGGLSLGCQLPPGVPWENIETLLETLDAVGTKR